MDSSLAAASAELSASALDRRTRTKVFVAVLPPRCAVALGFRITLSGRWLVGRIRVQVPSVFPWHCYSVRTVRGGAQSSASGAWNCSGSIRQMSAQVPRLASVERLFTTPVPRSGIQFVDRPMAGSCNRVCRPAGAAALTAPTAGSTRPPSAIIGRHRDFERCFIGVFPSIGHQPNGSGATMTCRRAVCSACLAARLVLASRV